MLPKKGIVLPNGKNLGPYAMAVAYALKSQLGTTHRAVKTIMREDGMPYSTPLAEIDW